MWRGSQWVVVRFPAGEKGNGERDECFAGLVPSV